MASGKLTPDRQRDASHLAQQALVANDRALERSRSSERPARIELQTLTIGAAYDAADAERAAARRFVQRSAAGLGHEVMAELLDILGLEA